VNFQINYSLFKKTDGLQDQIEADSAFDANTKIKYLRGLAEILNSYEVAYRARQVKGDQLPDLVNTYIEAISIEKRGLFN
jgi:hypothetical protein